MPLGDATPAETPPEQTPSPAPPAFVPTDEFKRLEGTVTGLQAQLTSIAEGIQALRLDRVQADAPPAAATVEDVSDEELDKILAEGRGAGAFRKMVRAEVERREQAHAGELTSLKQHIFGALESTVREVAAPKMKYYTRFQPEIDRIIQGAPAEQRLRPETYLYAYNLVVGAHAAELEAEALARGARATPEPADEPSGAGRHIGKSGSIPTVEDLMGRDAVAALAYMGRTADQHAQSLGYKDWATYAQLALE